jgi:hypothetical protein
VAADRELDAVLTEQTGFVGKYTAEYLIRSAPEEARIGLAGRSQAKLGRLRAGLGERAADWPLIVADSQDAAALSTMAQRTKVIATTVGPYATYGMDLVEACATISANSRATSSSTEIAFNRSTSLSVRMRWARAGSAAPRTPIRSSATVMTEILSSSGSSRSDRSRSRRRRPRCRGSRSELVDHRPGDRVNFGRESPIERRLANDPLWARAASPAQSGRRRLRPLT